MQLPQYTGFKTHFSLVQWKKVKSCYVNYFLRVTASSWYFVTNFNFQAFYKFMGLFQGMIFRKCSVSLSVEGKWPVVTSSGHKIFKPVDIIGF